MLLGRNRAIALKLSQANRRLKKAAKALAPKHKGGEWEEYHAALDEVRFLERELAKSRNEPYAEPCDFPVEWDVGAPSPMLLCNDYKTFLTFYVREFDPNWDGTYVKVVDTASGERVSLCLVTFKRCASAKLGHPNDEAQGGHPLYRRGLEGYTAQIVRNSPWLAEVARINSIHPYDKPELWRSLNHYVFWFHDSTFECLAESYEIELFSESMGELLSRIHRRFLE